jgi:uncharacterized protein YceH (UPF0502 family)
MGDEATKHRELSWDDRDPNALVCTRLGYDMMIKRTGVEHWAVVFRGGRATETRTRAFLATREAAELAAEEMWSEIMDAFDGRDLRATVARLEREVAELRRELRRLASDTAHVVKCR